MKADKLRPLDFQSRLNRRFFNIMLMVSLLVHAVVLVFFFNFPKKEQINSRVDNITLGEGGVNFTDTRSSETAQASSTKRQLAGSGALPVYSAEGRLLSNNSVSAVNGDGSDEPRTRDVAMLAEADKVLDASDSMTNAARQSPVPALPIEASQTGETQQLEQRLETAAIDYSLPALASEDSYGHALGTTSEMSAELLSKYKGVVSKYLQQWYAVPKEAEMLGLTGVSGLITMDIDKTGNIVFAMIYQSTGHPILDRQMLSIIANANNKVPAPPQEIFRGKSVASFNVPIHF